MSAMADRVPFGRLAFVGMVGSLATCYLKIFFLVFIWLGMASPPGEFLGVHCLSVMPDPAGGTSWSNTIWTPTRTNSTSST